MVRVFAPLFRAVTRDETVSARQLLSFFATSHWLKTPVLLRQHTQDQSMRQHICAHDARATYNTRNEHNNYHNTVGLALRIRHFVSAVPRVALQTVLITLGPHAAVFYDMEWRSGGLCVCLSVPIYKNKAQPTCCFRREQTLRGLLIRVFTSLSSARTKKLSINFF